MIFGKGRKKTEQFAMVTVALLCERGHEVGKVSLDVDPHPRAGRHRMEDRLEWVDSPSGGKVVAACRCGATPQWRWDRVTAELKSNLTAGQATGTLRA